MAAKSFRGKIEGLYTLSFKLDAATSELLYSFDNDTYKSTGVILKDGCKITGVEENDTEITIHIGDQSFTIVKPQEIEFEIRAGKVYFAGNETKSYAIKTSGLSDVYVMNKPDGWTVGVDGSKLTITSPKADNVYAAKSGLVLLHGSDENGNCCIAKISVTIGSEPFTIAIDKDYNMTLNVTGGVFQATGMWGDTYDVTCKDVFYGVCPADDFNPEALVSAINESGYAEAPDGTFNNFDQNEYDFVGTVTNSIPQMLNNDFPVGNYIVWAILRGRDANLTLTADDFVKVYVDKVEVSIETTPSWNDIAFSISVAGADEFLAMVMAKENCDSYVQNCWSGEGLQQYAQMGFGFADLFFPGTMHYSYHEYCSGSCTGNITTFGVTEEELAEGVINEVNPKSEWAIIVLPLTKDNKADYSLSDVTIYYTTAAGLVSGGAAAVTFSDNKTIGYNTATVSATTDGSLVYYSLFSESDLTDKSLSTDTDFVNYLLENEVKQSKEKSLDMVFNSLSLGTNYTVAALAVDADGKYGALSKTTFTTNSLPVSTELSASIESVTVSPDNAKEVTVVYSLTGATHLCVQGNSNGPSLTWSTGNIDSWVLNLVTQPEFYTLKKYTATDNKVSVTYSNYSTSNKYVYFVAYNVDDTGNVTSMSSAQAIDISTKIN